MPKPVKPESQPPVMTVAEAEQVIRDLEDKRTRLLDRRARCEDETPRPDCQPAG